LTVGGKILSRKNMQYNYSKKMFSRRTKPIRKLVIRISGVLLYLLFMLPFDVVQCEIMIAVHKVAP